MILSNKQFSTVIIKIGDYMELNQTVVTFNHICQEIIDYGWENNTWNKNKLHFGTYTKIRKGYPNFSSALVQTARDQASNILKRSIKQKNKQKPIKKEFSSIQYDKRCLSIPFSKKIISISTLFGRIKFPFQIAKYYEKYKDWKYTNAQLIKRKDNTYYLNIQVNQSIPKKIQGNSVLGIDLGIKKIAVCSNNTFYNSKKFRNVKGKYQKLKSDLQSKGTKSTKKKLKKISGKENRFVKTVNHIISKQIVNTDYNVFALENLKNISQITKTHNRKLNRRIGNWSFAQLQNFITYKAERFGKSVVFVKPNYTSQQCSKCSHTEKSNRKGNVFKCKSCNFELDVDLNASRNIARIGRTDFLQGSVNNPNVGFVENKAVKDRIALESTDKPINSLVGS